MKREHEAMRIVVTISYERDHTTCHRTCIAETLAAEMPTLEIIDL